MKKAIYSLLILLCVATVFSCKKLDGLNVNPVQPVTVPTSLRLPAIQANLAYSIYSQARWAAYHSYYVTNRAGNSSAQTDTWNYNSITRMGAWRWHYFDVGSNIAGPAGMLLRAAEEGSNNYTGVGKILLAFSYLTATDVFGDMPFTEAYTGTFNPVYDTQEKIYEGVEKLLDEGIQELNNVNATAASMPAKADLIYAGDYAKWRAFATAVKARLKLHTANFKNNYAEVATLANDALAGFDDALFRYPTTASTNWEKNLWGESRANPEWWFADIQNVLATSLPTDVLMKALTVDATNRVFDPRLYKLTTQYIVNNVPNTKYLGAKMSEGTSTSGLPTGTVFQDFANLSMGFWTSDTSDAPYMIKEELYFIKAEALFHSNDKEGAFTAYRQGIEHNLKRLSIDAGLQTSYMLSAKVAQSAAQLTIAHIMMQKWLALYLQPETWVDMRRYGYSTTAYPDLYYPRNALAEWSGRYIQRFPYDPQTEYIYNPKEIARLGAGVRSWAFTPVWWAEQSTLKN